MKKVLLQIVIYILINLISVPAFSETPFSIDGYYKNFSVVFNPPQKALFLNLPDEPIGMVNNRLRTNLFYAPSNWVSVTFAYDISPRIQDNLLFDENIIMTGFNPYRYRFDDLDSRLYPSKDKNTRSFGIFQNLDRMLLTLRIPSADIYIGRQAIAWGSARVINPMDIIAPFTFEELDTEDRIGVDAVRIRIPVGFMGEFDTGYVFGEDAQFGKSAFFVRSKLYVKQTDVSVLLLGFQNSVLAGIDLARSIGGAGFWLESAYVFVDALDDFETGKQNNYFRSTIGLDYSFTGNLYGFMEYHFSSAGASDPDDYLQNVTKPYLSEGAVYLLGKHYLIPGFTYQITPLIIFTGQTLWNISDFSIFIAPQVEYNIAQNIYVSAGAFLGVGEPMNTQTTSSFLPPVQFQSEFGSYPNIYFSSFRIYF